MPSSGSYVISSNFIAGVLAYLLLIRPSQCQNVCRDLSEKEIYGYIFAK